MKTTSYFRVIIIVAVMMTTACSDLEILPSVKPVSSNTQTQNREFHTTVTTWGQPNGSHFVGIVSNVPSVDLSKARISVVNNGKVTSVDNVLDLNKLTWVQPEGYFWAKVQNNILLLNYIGSTPTSLPPFPLDVIIVY